MSWVGVGRPVGAQCLDYIHVAEEEDGFFSGCTGGAEADDEVLLALIGTEQVYVFGGKAGIEEELLHGRGGGGDVAKRRIGSVDLDELLEEVAGFRAIRVRGFEQRGLGQRGGGEADGSDAGHENNESDRGESHVLAHVRIVLRSPMEFRQENWRCPCLLEGA
jgi:hypothetical protein